MAPYLQTVKSFAAVPVTDAGVETAAFCDAVDGLIGIFGLLGSAAFTPVVTDLQGNVKKVRARYASHPEQSGTLEELVKNEFTNEKKRPASEGLMWLLRGLSFTGNALSNAQKNTSEELSTAFTKSYEGTLKPHHGLIVKGVFAVAMKACPYRADFYKKLKADPAGGAELTDDQLNSELNPWLEALQKIVTRLQTFYEKNGYNKGF